LSRNRNQSIFTKAHKQFYPDTMKKRLFTVCLFLLLGGKGIAQELPQLNTYMFNQFLYNPASGGMYETDFNCNFVSRFQWAGVSGAPLTSFAWADHRFRKNSMSAGLYLAYDRVGARQFTDVAANYTYILRLNNKWKLSFGLRAGFTSLSFNLTNSEKVFDAGDPLAQGYVMNYPKFGGGVQLYARNFYIGIGVPDIASINTSVFAADRNKNFFQKNRNYSLLTGYRWRLSDGFSLLPSSKIYYYPGNPVRVDLSALAEITDYFWAGGSFISTGSASVMAGSYISSRLRFSYAYQFPIQSNVNTNIATLNVHEIVLMIQLDDLFARKNKKIVE